MWLESPNIKSPHGFSDRHGGVSPYPFDSLNLGGSDDAPGNIAENRRIALSDKGISSKQLCFLKQIHSPNAVEAQPGQQEGDALVTNTRGLALAVSAADCYPVLFEDITNSVIGAAHAGWRGTLAGVCANTLQKMISLGADINKIRVAIGQGISRDKFEVGAEVIDAFRHEGYSENCFLARHLDLLMCIQEQLQKAGLDTSQVWSMKRCSTESDFFSYRRDKGMTGRMWGLICLRQ